MRSRRYRRVFLTGRIDTGEQLLQVAGETMSFRVSTFYKFVNLTDLQAYRDPLRLLCASHGIRGTILLAPEGINGTIAGEAAAVAEVIAAIRNYDVFSNLESKESLADEMPFSRLKVRMKKEIATLGVRGLDPAHRTGTYVIPEDWNALISEPDILVIDTRNSFEVAAGTFHNAIDPGTERFGEFPAFVRERLNGDKKRKIAMFCTGGIRCEKATSYLLSEGFEQVYHLKGGILKYLEAIAPAQSLWRGSCFVFDGRAGIGHGLTVPGVAMDKSSET